MEKLFCQSTNKFQKLNIVRMPNIIIGTKISGSQKQITSEGKFARKKIIPIAEATFSTELDPHAFKFKFVEYK